jgi:hypothetical protein
MISVGEIPCIEAQEGKQAALKEAVRTASKETFPRSQSFV